MKLDNRITLYMIVLIVLVIIQPCVFAQGGSRGGRGGDNRGDMMGGSGRGGERGEMMGGGGRGERDMGGRGSRGGMPYQEEPVTDAQIDRIVKMFSMSHSPQETKILEDQRKNLSREQFIWTLRGTAWREYMEVMREEGEYRGILVWCEEFTPDEAKGIRELKDENFDLYKKRLDSLNNKYRSLINRRPQPSKELMRVLVSDLQLELKQRDLTRQYWTATDSAKKESIFSELKDVISQRYDRIVEQKQIQYTDLQNQIKKLQENVEGQLKDITRWKDPDFKAKEVDDQLNRWTKPTPTFRRGPFGGPQGMPIWPPYPMPGTNMIQGPNSISEPNK